VGTFRFAIARAGAPDGIVPDQDVVAFKAAEQAYVNAVRLDLGMSTMDVSLWTSPPETSRGPRQGISPDQ
jgi:hypothetical protein